MQITTDQFFLNISDSLPTLKISRLDKKILISLNKQLLNGVFLTENQSILLLKILKIHRLALGISNDELLDNPTWTTSFRVIDTVRKIYTNASDPLMLIVEFTFDKEIKQRMSNTLPSLVGPPTIGPNGSYIFRANEHNIYTLISALKKYKFVIDNTLLQIYNEILVIKANKAYTFDIFDSTMISVVNKYEPNISLDNLMLLNDRRYRYQYTISKKDSSDKLANKIANRLSTSIWINSATHTLQEVIASLIELDRLPLLTVFDGYDSDHCTAALNSLTVALNSNAIDSDIGIYFRFDNNGSKNKEFNNIINTLHLNTKLSSTTKVTGITSNKLPKFMPNHEWYPNSIISFTSALKNNKTGTYANAVDLIIYYTPQLPLKKDIHAIV